MGRGACEDDDLPARCARRRREGRADRYEHQRGLPGRAARRTGTGRKIGSTHKADAWLTPKGTIAVYDHREQELYTYDEYGAFADDEGIDERLRADVADALGEKYVEELDI
jgi:hypothetical protein